MRRLWLLAVLACRSDATEAVPDTSVAPSAEVTAARYLTGRFDSADQAAEDPDYYSILLVVCPIELPGLGERVLYVEQSVTQDDGTVDDPYRLRLYVVEPGEPADTQAISHVYEFDTPRRFIGACDAPVDVNGADVFEREGCEVTLDATPEGFAGGTSGEGCASDLAGAAYATSEVTLTVPGLDSWDRGFDAGGAQVWGADRGPYRFVRRTAL